MSHTFFHNFRRGARRLLSGDVSVQDIQAAAAARAAQVGEFFEGVGNVASAGPRGLVRGATGGQTPEVEAGGVVPVIGDVARPVQRETAGLLDLVGRTANQAVDETEDIVVNVIEGAGSALRATEEEASSVLGEIFSGPVGAAVAVGGAAVLFSLLR